MNTATAAINLVYDDILDESYLADLITDLKQTGLDVEVESRENDAFCGIEHYMPAVAAIYVTKIFLDDFLKRAAKDVNDQLYPAFKRSIARFAHKIFSKPPVQFLASSPNKLQAPDALLFSIYCQLPSNTVVKFTFLSGPTEEEYWVAVGIMLDLLRQNYADQDNILSTPTRPGRQVVLVYDLETHEWQLCSLTSRLPGE